MSEREEAERREPTRDEVERLAGLVVLEFGASWCGHCRALRPHLAALLEQYPQVRHIGIEDGPGQPLGRSFRVKLWPTLVLLRDGRVVRQLVRPSAEQLAEGFSDLAANRSRE